MNAQIGLFPTKEAVEAETAAIEKDQIDFQTRHDATDLIIKEVNQQIAENSIRWSALQVRRANLEAMKAGMEKVQYLGDYRQWLVIYLKSHSPVNTSEGIHYKVVAQAAIDAGVTFPTKKGGDSDTYFANVAKHVNSFLNNSSYANPPLFKKTKGGHYRSVQGDVALYRPQAVAQPLAPPAPMPEGAPTVVVNNGPVYGTNDQYTEVVDRLVPFLVTLSSQKGPIKEDDVLFYFREGCKGFTPSLYFKNKERRFWSIFFRYCGVTGPLECWEMINGAGGATHTETKFQKAGNAPLMAPWRKIVPVAPEQPPKVKRPKKS